MGHAPLACGLVEGRGWFALCLHLGSDLEPLMWGEGRSLGNLDGARGMKSPLCGAWDSGCTDQVVRWDPWVNMWHWPSQERMASMGCSSWGPGCFVTQTCSWGLWSGLPREMRLSPAHKRVGNNGWSRAFQAGGPLCIFLQHIAGILSCCNLHVFARLHLYHFLSFAL